jgi:hypothetical protein
MRSGKTLQRTMTPARRAWLERLMVAPERYNGLCASDCRNLGWSEPLYRRGDEMASKTALMQAHGNSEAIRLAGWRFSSFETITPLGRKVLLNPEPGDVIEKSVLAALRYRDLTKAYG